MVSNWFLYIGVFLVASGFGLYVGIIFVAVWLVGCICDSNKKREPDVHNHYSFEGDKIVNIKAKQGSKKYVFDGQIGDWR